MTYLYVIKAFVARQFSCQRPRKIAFVDKIINFPTTFFTKVQNITGCKKMGEEITEVLEYQPGELHPGRMKLPDTLRREGKEDETQVG